MCKLIELGGQEEQKGSFKTKQERSAFGRHSKPVDAEGFNEAAIEHTLNLEDAVFARLKFFLKKKYKRRLPPSE